MKRSKRRLPIPQHEFGFTPQAFNLFQDTTMDGERIARERDEADRARRAAEAAQPGLFAAILPDDD
jgi:ABC-type transport system involved in Fe-S cluster assembly fused permease/ATPase subunit